MNENPTIEVHKLQPITRFIYTLGALPTSYLMSMTYEEQLVWLCNYISQTMIPALNNNVEAVQELQRLYEDLQEYVNNYFDNLDIQTEVNNKINDMYEAGTLQEIITEYLQVNGVLGFDNLSSLKNATNLISGSLVETYGYYESGDGGNAKYKVREVTNQDVVDDMFIIALHDESLVAELIIENKILNVLKLGIKNDNSADISTKLNTICQNYSVFLPAGEYKVDNTINLKYSLYGEGYGREGGDFNGKTILKSNVISNSIKINGNSNQISQIIKDINIKVDSNITDSSVITYDPINEQTRCYITNVSINNFCGIGINLDPAQTGVNFISRGVYINNITLLARPYQNSKGIYCSNKVGDITFSNLEIMFVKIGIDNRSSCNISNTHIWTGGTGEDSNNWWNSTRGIFNYYGTIQATNLYIDTSSIALVNDNGNIMIDNFRYWIDDSISGSNNYSASICYGVNYKDYLNILINNAYIFISDRIKYINGTINNLKLLYNSLSNLDLNSLSNVKDIIYSLTYSQSGSTTRYLPVAIIQKANNGYSEIDIAVEGGQNSKLKISYDWTSNLVIKGSYFNKNNNYYYKVDGNKYIIYLESNTQNNNIDVIINNKSKGLFPINLNDLINLQNKNFISDDYITTDNTGLTQITQTQVNT